MAALQELLEELPEILERKFQGRLRALREQHHLLERDNRRLRRRLLALDPNAEAESLPMPPRGLLPASVRTALRLRQVEAGQPLNDGVLTRDALVDPTRR